MDYLDFVLEHRKPSGAVDDHNSNLFEKVLVAPKRARELYEVKTPAIPELNQHKFTSVAIYEINHNLIVPVVKDQKYKDIEGGDNFDDYESDED